MSDGTFDFEHNFILFLCRRCKGLFVNDSQLTQHVSVCTGDAFKSPAELFACERERFLVAAAVYTSFTGTADKINELLENDMHLSRHIIDQQVPWETFSVTQDSENLCMQAKSSQVCDETDIRTLATEPGSDESVHNFLNDIKNYSIISENSTYAVGVEEAVYPTDKPAECSNSLCHETETFTDHSILSTNQTQSNLFSVNPTSTRSSTLFKLLTLQQDCENPVTDDLSVKSLHNLPTENINSALVQQVDSTSRPIINNIPESESDKSSVSASHTFSVGFSKERKILNEYSDKLTMLVESNSTISYKAQSVYDELAGSNAYQSEEAKHRDHLLSDSSILKDTMTKAKEKGKKSKSSKSESSPHAKLSVETMQNEIFKKCTVVQPEPDSKSKKQRFRCNLCGHTSAHVTFMFKHLQTHNNGEKFRCDQCDFTCMQRSRLTEHQSRHFRKLLCHHCTSTFVDMSSLNRHIASKHSDNPAFKCELCDFLAPHSSSLTEHMRKHTGETLSCDVDGCTFKTVYHRALQLHKKRHTAEKKYACHLCSYRAVESHSLTRHLKTHEAARPFQCSSCPFMGITKYEVVRHMRSKHLQQKQYACDKCPFRTAYPTNIVRHLLGHLGTDADSYACPVCHQPSNSLASAKTHLQRVHGKIDMDILVVKEPVKINTSDYICKDSLTAGEIENECMDRNLVNDVLDEEPASMVLEHNSGIDHAVVDPMKISFHFQDTGSSNWPSNTGVSITRSSSIPDLFTFSCMNSATRSNSQTDLLTFSGATIMRSNSMSDLVSFASSMCVESVEAVNKDVSLSDATAPSIEGHSLSLGDVTEVGVGVRPGSPGGVVLAVQCPRCLGLLMSEEDVDAHNNTCTGQVQIE